MYRNEEILPAGEYLLTLDDVRGALQQATDIQAQTHGARTGMGEVLRAAARDSAYCRYTGLLGTPNDDLPLAVSVLVLLFADARQAAHTFDQVAQAAHLRTDVEGSHVAVETVAAPGGMVSYWGYVYRDEAMVIITLDSLSPQSLSVADLRSLVLVAARRLDRR